MISGRQISQRLFIISYLNLSIKNILVYLILAPLLGLKHSAQVGAVIRVITEREPEAAHSQ